ncbi:cystathionine gamma-lyase-like [Parasteatoda tepidariorum]|uniref:cystathionine gamma-lyase-like n=1 Tax=Parasteatoda tepidariorum TaxID=114398 RepID=UPI00077FA278|nr:cystathionine gamma-lyase-like [Parasteatoda tepidariorum]
MLEFDTRAVHGGEKIKEVKPSIELHTHYDEISAISNPSKQRLEKCIASLEHAKYALCFSSGIAAVTSISQLLEIGDHVVLFDSVYHGTRTMLSIRESLGEIDVTFADLREADDLKKYLRKNTKMVWIETPCNPTMKLVDIAAVAHIVKTQSKAFLVVDNTFMSPYCQNPLLLGADIAMHSLTKYMNGHGDVLMGAAATGSEEYYAKLKESAELIGSLPSPLDCYLVLRGLKTLHLRMERHMENASQIAYFLEQHPNVEKVFYPGLKSHPQHELALKQCKGFGGMVSFCVKGGIEKARKVAVNIKIFILAVSLGSSESLMDVSSLMTAGCVTKEKRAEMGIPENLIRLSVGLESVKDLINDLDRALRA